MCAEAENIKNIFKDNNKREDTDREEMVSQRVHVIKRGEGWGMLKEGTSRVSYVYTTKQEAIEEGREFKELGYDLVIHKKDGSIQRWEKAKKKRTIKTPKVTGKISRKAIKQAVKKVISKRVNLD